MERLHLVEKKSYTVWAEILASAAAPREVYNYLEKVHYLTNKHRRVIITGTASEQYVVDDTIFCSNYTFEDGSPVTREWLDDMFSKEGTLHIPARPYLTKPSTSRKVARHIPLGSVITVTTQFNDILVANAPGVYHGDGDWVVMSILPTGEPDESYARVVNGAVFKDTYTILS